MKKILITLLFIVIFLLVGSMMLCGQALTPAENIFTGNCKVFKTTCTTPIIYKESKKCRTFWAIKQRIEFAKYHNETESEYWDKINQDKKAIEKLCSSLEQKHQVELFKQYKVESCMEIVNILDKI